MRHQEPRIIQTAFWLPMTLALALLLVLIVELALRIE
jgi:hypothetical protein